MPQIERPHSQPHARARSPRRRAGLATCVLLATQIAVGLAQAEVPPELGRVEWRRDLEASLQESERSGRPVFVLFQEVPGCATCVSFGRNVLDHPLLAEAIETAFVPMLVYNNRGGDDRAWLGRFGEPAWNNPVVRMLDPEARDLVPRRAGVWTPEAIGARMIAALRAADRPVPGYLAEAVDELGAKPARRAIFGMHCFWSGEACLGDLPGVLSSRAAFLEGREVVELEYDEKVVSYAQLLASARERGCAREVFARTSDELEAARAVFGEAARLTRRIPRSAPDSDQKRALRATPYAELDLTPRQAMRVNADVAAGRSPTRHLSPRQQRQLVADAKAS